VHALHVVGYPRTAKVLRLPPILWCIETGYAFVATHRLLVSRFIFRRIPTRIMPND
jgi:hypothetical protein